MRSTYVHRRLENAMSRSQTAIEKETGRLSSGKKLTSAADNSASKAVEVQLNARVRSHHVAQRNADYAVALCRTAQGGLTEIQSSVLRLQQLAVQSANDSITDNERGFLQTEANGVLEGIDNIAFGTKVHEDQPLLHQVPVDIGFIIDVSGSMSGNIGALKAAISTFADNVVAKGFNVAFGLSVGGNGVDNADASDLLEDIGSAGFNASLQGLTSGPGGAMEMYSSLINASTTDHPGANDPDKFDWRTGSNRYVVVLTDTVAQEGAPLLPGNPSQQAVANELAAGEVTVHVIGRSGGPQQASFSQITSTTGGTYENIGAVGSALDDIEVAIENDLDSVSQLTFQTGIKGDAASRVKSRVAIDATALGLGLDGFDISSLADAQSAIDGLQVSFDNLNQHMTTYATLENRLVRLSTNTANAAVNEEASKAQIADVDFADSTAHLAVSQTLLQSSVTLLNLFDDVKSGMVLNLMSSIRNSVSGGAYA